MWLSSPVWVSPGRKHQRQVFLWRGSNALVISQSHHALHLFLTLHLILSEKPHGLLQQSCPHKDPLERGCINKYRNYVPLSQSHNALHVFQTHQYQCPRYPIPCPNRCDPTKIPREEVDIHVQELCPSATVSCSFKHAGCQYKVCHVLLCSFGSQQM